MNKFIKIVYSIIVFLLITNCSFDTKSGIWSGKKKLKATNNKNYEVVKLSKNEEIIKNEFNTSLKITLKHKSKKNEERLLADINSFNLVPHMIFDGNIETISKYKFGKIKKYKSTEPDLIITKNFIIFYDKNGSILKFDKNTNLLWSKNIYSKKEKKNISNLSFAITKKNVFIADNLGKYYALDLDTGKMLWSKKVNAPFNSQIKIKNDKLFIVDINNVLWCISNLNGSIVWKVQTSASLITTKKKLSLVLSKNSVIFSNSVGDVTKVDIDTGEFIWQIPTQNTLLKNSTNFLKTSDLVMLGENIFFSNNKNQFFSINEKLGVFQWKQNVNSSIRPIIIDNIIFTVSVEGFLILIDLDTGKIIRATYLLEKFKEKVRDSISFEGFVIASNKAFITTNTGFVIICPILNGKVEQNFKISKSSLSKPFIRDNNLYIIKDDAIIVLN